jgi:iron complex transport system substrate-binding protein
VRRGFDGFPASTVTVGSTDCCDELPAVWASATTLDAVAATQASPTLNLQVDEKSELLPKSETIVLENIDDIPQHSASLRRLILRQSLVPSSEVQFRGIQIALDALLINQAFDARHSATRRRDRTTHRPSSDSNFGQPHLQHTTSILLLNLPSIGLCSRVSSAGSIIPAPTRFLHFMLPLLRWGRSALGLATILVIAFGELSAANAIDLTDQRNRKLSFSRLPERLVIIPIPAPSTFMTIDGSDRKIVGMNEYAARGMQEGIFGKLFPGFRQIQTAITTGGDASNFAPNVEAILALRPDAVFQWANNNEIIGPLDRTGIPVVGMRVGSFENYVDYVKLMGKIAGREDRASELLRKQEETRQSLTSRFADLSSTQRPRVLYFNRVTNMLRVSGKGTAQDFAIELAGGQNAVGTASISTITIEQILAWNPQVILLGNFDPAMPSDLYRDPRWQGIEAVQARRVYRVPLGGYRWDPPSHESALGWLWLAGLLHPERAQESIRTSVKSWFGFLYNYNPTDEEIDGILFLKDNAGSAGYEAYRAH